MSLAEAFVVTGIAATTKVTPVVYSRSCFLLALAAFQRHTVQQLQHFNPWLVQNFRRLISKCSTATHKCFRGGNRCKKRDSRGPSPVAADQSCLSAYGARGSQVEFYTAYCTPIRLSSALGKYSVTNLTVSRKPMKSQNRFCCGFGSQRAEIFVRFVANLVSVFWGSEIKICENLCSFVYWIQYYCTNEVRRKEVENEVKKRYAVATQSLVLRTRTLDIYITTQNNSNNSCQKDFQLAQSTCSFTLQIAAVHLTYINYIVNPIELRGRFFNGYRNLTVLAIVFTANSALHRCRCREKIATHRNTVY